MTKSGQVVIAGAGIAGIATAWHLARRMDGASVVLVDPRPPLSLTSDRPEANYRNWWPQPAMVALASRSIDLMERLRSSSPGFAMNRRGYLYVTGDTLAADGLPAMVQRYHDAGLGPDAADILDHGDLQARYPHLAPAILGAIHARRAGSVDAVGLGRAMLDEATERGVRVIAGEVVGLDVDSDGLCGVHVSDTSGGRRIATRRFVDAAGPFAVEVARLIGVGLPIETVLRQKVLLHDPLGVVPRDAPFTIGLDALDGRPSGVHIKPDDSVAGDAIKLGWAVDQLSTPPLVDPACPPGYPLEVLARAATIIPGLGDYLDRELQVIEHDGGFYARTPDGLPLIGPLEVDGAFVLGGLAGFGAMLACGAGELAASWVLGDAPTADAAAFHPGRFRDGSALDTRPSGQAPRGEL